LFAKISLSCVSTSSSAVMLTDFIQGFSWILSIPPCKRPFF